MPQETPRHALTVSTIDWELTANCCPFAPSTASLIVPPEWVFDGASFPGTDATATDHGNYPEIGLVTQNFGIDSIFFKFEFGTFNLFSKRQLHRDCRNCSIADTSFHGSDHCRCLPTAPRPPIWTLCAACDRQA